MQWLLNIDIGLFRFINSSLANSLFDQVMPFASGNELARAILHPVLLLGAAILIWKGKARGVLCVLMLIFAVALADGMVSRTLKYAIGRDRPFLALDDVRCLVGKSGSGSMPSSHAANWFAAVFVAFVYYRRSLWFMLPAACLVSFSRVYNGVHYPSDVLAGAVLGAGTAASVLCVINAVWQWAGRKFFPLWWEQMPSLVALRPKQADEAEDGDETIDAPLPKVRGMAPAGFRAPHATLDDHWLRLGYIFVALLLVGRWLYLASGTIELSEDEAYQWVWSKHLALSYYSKPLLIAVTQFLGTSLWGDTAFGVRFFSPLISAVISVLMLRFFAREVNARAGFFLLLITTVTPLLAVGAVLMTVDPLSVLFWTAAMLAGWRATQDTGTVKDWLWVGLWMGLGFLSKYTQLAQLVCWAVFFILWRPARKHLRRPGPYLAVLLNIFLSLPVLIWNWQRDWITARHVADDAGAHDAWHPTLRYVGDFLGAELGLLNPVFFVAMVWVAIVFWRRNRQNPKLVYFFSMGAPLFLIYFLHSFKSRVLPNWIAPSVLPLFCMMVIYWDARWRLGAGRLKPWLVSGLLLGAAIVAVCYNTDIVRKVTGHYLPVNLDPLHRVRGWGETARVVGQARQELLAEGKPVFIITDHYGITGQLSFYMPEARENIQATPIVYFRYSPKPLNQFYFWPSYTGRKGENALFILELDRDSPVPLPIPEQFKQEFESVTDLGVRNVMYHDTMLLRPIQFFACRNLK